MRKMTRAQFLWSTLMVTSALLYRPFRFWANNAWTLAAPEDLFKVVLIELVVAIALLAIVSLVPVKEVIPGILVTALAFYAFNLGNDPSPLAIALLVLVVLALVLLSLRRPISLKTIATITAVVLAGAPALQVVLAHVQQRPTFPIMEFSASEADASEAVEDVVLLVVDGYPMRRIAEDLFDHDGSALTDVLIKAGFTSPEVSWSHNSYTALAIPGMVSLDQVANVDSTVEWRNQKSNYSVARGNNRVVSLLDSAGFDYTHIEGGWNGDVCDEPDQCLRSGIWDEATWKLLDSSVFIGIAESRWGSQEALNTTSTLTHLLQLDVFDDGAHDFVYAHMMLPHFPQVVDEACLVVPVESRGETPADIRAQMTCVDSMLIELVGSLSDSTAVVIAGDHGTETLGQLEKPGERWTDDEIAERLGAFLAYRLPAGCTAPVAPTNIEAMRALVACATDFAPAAERPKFVVGLSDLYEVDEARLHDISDRLESLP